MFGNRRGRLLRKSFFFFFGDFGGNLRRHSDARRLASRLALRLRLRLAQASVQRRAGGFRLVRRRRRGHRRGADSAVAHEHRQAHRGRAPGAPGAARAGANLHAELIAVLDGDRGAFGTLRVARAGLGLGLGLGLGPQRAAARDLHGLLAGPHGDHAVAPRIHGFVSAVDLGEHPVGVAAGRDAPVRAQRDGSSAELCERVVVVREAHRDRRAHALAEPRDHHRGRVDGGKNHPLASAGRSHLELVRGGTRRGAIQSHVRDPKSAFFVRMRVCNRRRVQKRRRERLRDDARRRRRDLARRILNLDAFVGARGARPKRTRSPADHQRGDAHGLFFCVARLNRRRAALLRLRLRLSAHAQRDDVAARELFRRANDFAVHDELRPG